VAQRDLISVFEGEIAQRFDIRAVEPGTVRGPNIPQRDSSVGQFNESVAVRYGVVEIERHLGEDSPFVAAASDQIAAIVQTNAQRLE
jgi:hypothetical protein